MALSQLFSKFLNKNNTWKTEETYHLTTATLPFQLLYHNEVFLHFFSLNIIASDERYRVILIIKVKVNFHPNSCVVFVHCAF
jgi:hypothetical protein